MDYIGCDMNNLDVDVRLPPRKRFLASLKRQSCSENSSCSQENNPSPDLTSSVENIPNPNLSLSIDYCLPSEFDDRLKNLFKSHKDGCNMSPEEIALAAQSAADVAVKAAKAARAVAEEKASIASKAVAVAKSALKLVASQRRNSRQYKKNKLKKNVPAQLVYNKYKPFEGTTEDEELAKKLHRAMNSSPRISKHSLDCESMNNKCKKLKIRLRSSRFCETGEVEVDSDDGESSYAKWKSFEGFDDGVWINGRTRKRGRSSKDPENPEKELSLTNPSITRVRFDKSLACHLPMEVAPT